MSARSSRLFHRLQLAAHKLQKIADREISAATDLTTAQAAVLSVLANGEGTTQREIADALGQNESAITAMVSRLTRLEYVTKVRSTTDARAWELSLSKSGRTALQATKKPFSKLNRFFERELSSGEIAALADILERLSENADDI